MIPLSFRKEPIIKINKIFKFIIVKNGSLQFQFYVLKSFSRPFQWNIILFAGIVRSSLKYTSKDSLKIIIFGVSENFSEHYGIRNIRGGSSEMKNQCFKWFIPSKPFRIRINWKRCDYSILHHVLAKNWNELIFTCSKYTKVILFSRLKNFIARFLYHMGNLLRSNALIGVPQRLCLYLYTRWFSWQNVSYRICSSASPGSNPLIVFGTCLLSFPNNSL